MKDILPIFHLMAIHPRSQQNSTYLCLVLHKVAYLNQWTHFSIHTHKQGTVTLTVPYTRTALYSLTISVAATKIWKSLSTCKQSYGFNKFLIYRLDQKLQTHLSQHAYQKQLSSSQTYYSTVFHCNPKIDYDRRLMTNAS